MKTKTRAERRKRDPEATRECLLHCAFEEMYEHGYAGASLDRILANSGVTKGALYHHFGSKAELAHAVIDELIRPFVIDRWVAPLQGVDDPITALVENCSAVMCGFTEHEMACGCPLNNLTQELASTDDEFRARLASVFDDWRGGLAEAFAHGQAVGTVRDDVDPSAVAAFIVSSFAGLATTMKSHRDRQLLESVASVFGQFLEGLRPPASGAAAA